jgi:hypothetical protein
MQQNDNESTKSKAGRRPLLEPDAPYSTHLTPMREGDAFWGALENRSHDQLIRVNSLNVASEGLLLGMQVGHLANQSPP